MSGFMPEIPRSALFNEDNLIWMDLEMTGLEPQVNRILEMAAVITDPQLNVIAEGPVVVIHQTPQVLNAMDSWNTSHHTKSGLVRKSLESEIDEAQAADITIAFSLSMFLQGRALCAAIPSGKTEDSWLVGCRILSSFSIIETLTFLQLRSVLEDGLLKS